jgi:hypothetical protein
LVETTKGKRQQQKKYIAGGGRPTQKDKDEESGRMCQFSYMIDLLTHTAVKGLGGGARLPMCEWVTKAQAALNERGMELELCAYPCPASLSWRMSLSLSLREG